MATYADILAKRRGTSSLAAATPTKTATQGGSSTYADMLNKRRGIVPKDTVVKKKATPVDTTPGPMSKVPTIDKTAGPMSKAPAMSVVPKTSTAPVPEPAKKMTLTDKITGVVKTLGSLGSMFTPGAIAGKVSSAATGEALKKPTETLGKVGNAAARVATSAAGSVVKALNFGQRYIKNNPTALVAFNNPALKGVLDRTGVNDKARDIALWADKWDPTGPLLQKAGESLDAYGKRISPITEEFERAPWQEKITKRLPETLYNYLPDTAGAMAPYLLNPELGAAVMFGSTANDIKGDAMSHGVSEKDAESLAVKASAAISLLDRFGIGNKLTPGAKAEAMTLFRKNLSKLLKVADFAKEPATEILQEKIQIAAERTFKDVTKSEEDERTAMAGFLSVFMDQGFRGAGKAKEVLATRREPPGFEKVPTSLKNEFMSIVSKAQEEKQATGDVSPETMTQFTALSSQVDQVIEIERINDVKAKVFDETFNQPIDQETRKMVDQIKEDPDLRFNFEQIMVDLNAENDPELDNKTINETGLRFQRVTDPNDTLLKGRAKKPGFYDAELGQIIFNQSVIDQNIHDLINGKTIIFGEGRQVRPFRVKQGETLAELTKRYEDTILDHEMAHVKTITSEDLAAFREAQAKGDIALARKLKVDLEERALKYSVENVKTELPENVKQAISATVDRQSKLAEAGVPGQDTYARTEKEAAYKTWKRLVTRTPELKNAYYDTIQKDIGAQSANQRFEDALSREGGPDATFDGLIADFQRRYANEMKMMAKRRDVKNATKDAKEAFDKLPDRMKAAIRREVRSSLKEGSTVDPETLLQRVTDRVTRNEIRWQESAPARRRVRSIERTKTMKSIRRLVRQARLNRSPSGTLKSKVSVEAQRLINGSKKDGIVGIAHLLGENRQDVLNTVGKKIVKFWDDPKNATQTQIPEALATEMLLAKTAGISQQSVSELRETEAIIKEIIEKGKTERMKDIQFQRDETQRFVEAVNKNLSGSEAGFENEAINSSERDSLMTKIKGLPLGGAPPKAIMNRLGKEGANLLTEAQHKEQIVKQMRADLWTKIEAKGKEIFGDPKEYGAVLKKWNDPKKISLGEFTDANDKQQKLKLPMDVIVRMYAARNDVDFMRNITSQDGHAFTDEMVDAAFSKLSEKEKSYIDAVVKSSYGAQYEKTAKNIQKYNGVDLGFREGYAGGIKYEQDMHDADIAENAPVDMVKDVMGIHGSTNKNIRKGSNSYQKSRTGKTGRMRFDGTFLQNASRYVYQTEWYNQMAGDIPKWKKLVSGETRRAMQKKYGSNFVKIMDSLVQDVENGGVTTQRVLDDEKLFNRIMGNYSGSLLASPMVWAGQIPAYFQFAAEAGGRDAGTFLKSSMTKGFDKDFEALMKEHAPAVDARILPEINKALADIGAKPQTVFSVIENIGQKLNIPLEKVDSVVTKLGARGLFDARIEKYQRQGMSLEKARKQAGRDVTEAIINTQSSNSFLGKSHWERNPGVFKPITMLKNQPTKMAYRLKEKVQEAIKKDLSPAEFAYYFTMANVVQPAVYVAIRHKTKAARTGAAIALLKMAGGAAAKALADELEKKQKEDDKQLKNNILANIVSTMGSYPLLNDALNWIMQSKMSGKNFDYRPTLVGGLMDDVTEALQLMGSEVPNAKERGKLKAASTALKTMGIGDPAALAQFMDMYLKQGGDIIKKSAKYKAQKKVEKARKKIEKAREKALGTKK